MTDVAPERDLRPWADYYTSLGFKIFPVRGKQPATAHGFKDATDDPGQLDLWFGPNGDPEYGIAIATGRASGIVVIDVDGTDGEATIEWMRDQLDEPFPPTLTFQTPGKLVNGTHQGKGRHLVYRYPADPTIRIPSSTGKVGNKVDVRADVAYIVAPPSEHPDGTGLYALLDNLLPAELPEWFVNRQSKPANQVRPTSPTTAYQTGDGETSTYGARALEAAASEAANAPEGTRNDTLNRQAFKIGQLMGGGHISPMDAYTALITAARQAGLEDQESHPTLERGLLQGAEHPRGPEDNNVELPTEWIEAYNAQQRQQPQTDDTTSDVDINPAPAPFHRRTIKVNDRDLYEIVDDCLEALVSRNDAMMSVGTGAARDWVIRNRLHHLVLQETTFGKKGVPLLQFLPHDTDTLRHSLSEAASFVTESRDKDDKLKRTKVLLKREYVAALLNEGMWGGVKQVRRVIETPLVAPDGNLIMDLGYHEDLQLVYFPRDGLQFVQVPEWPTASQVHDAVDLLKEPFLDFPLASEADWANLFAYILTPFLVDFIDGPIPWVGFKAAARGTGKSLCAQAAAVLATGREFASFTAPTTDTEWNKSILSVLLEAHPMVLVDNVDEQIESKSVASLLTNRSYTSRILGKSQMSTVPNDTVWAFTGNNPTTSKEIARRTYWINFGLPPQASKRVYRHGADNELIQWIKQNRIRLVQAILTVIRAWFAAEQPAALEEPPPMPSFGTWNDTIAGILSYAGIKGFRNNAETTASETDQESQNWQHLLEGLRLKFGDAEFTTGQAASVIQYGGDGNGPMNTELREFVPEKLAFHLERPAFNTHLGQAFQKITGQPFGPDDVRIRIEAGSKVNNARKWHIVSDNV